MFCSSVLSVRSPRVLSAFGEECSSWACVVGVVNLNVCSRVRSPRGAGLWLGILAERKVT